MGGVIKVTFPEGLKERVRLIHHTMKLEPGGVVIWKNPLPPYGRLAGKVAGFIVKKTPSKHYHTISIAGKRLPRSYVVFVLSKRRWPRGYLDHIDGNSLNDSPENLREATQLQNVWNERTYSGKTSGLPRGVFRSSGSFAARIRPNRKDIYLGTFKTPEEASIAYQAARRKYYGKFA